MKFLNKKVLVISLIVLPLFILAVFSAILLQKQKAQTPVKSPKEILIEKQLKELDELRQEVNGQPLSQKQIQKQLEELNKLHLSK